METKEKVIIGEAEIVEDVKEEVIEHKLTWGDKARNFWGSNHRYILGGLGLIAVGGFATWLYVHSLDQEVLELVEDTVLDNVEEVSKVVGK